MRTSSDGMNDSHPALSSMVSRAPVAMMVVDHRGVIREVNDEAERLFGWPRSELVDSPVEVLVPGPMRQLHAERRAEFAAQPRSRHMGSSSRLEARHRDGHLFTVDVMLAPIEGSVLVVVVDRSELRRVEDSLRKKNATFSHVLENVQDVVYVVRTNGSNPFAAEVELVSNHVERVVGWRVDELMSDPELWLRCIHPDDLPELSRATQEMFSTRRAVVRRYRMRHKQTGEWRLLEDRASLLFDGRDAVSGYCGVARDVSDERVARASDVIQERMTSLGLLAAGVSHELSNPLTCVLAAVDHAATILRDRPDEIARARSLLEDALDGIVRMRAVLADLSNVKSDSKDGALVDVRRSVEMALRISHAVVGERASITRDFAEVGPVRGNETKLAQVFLNLLLNAAHAIPGDRQGTIVISTRDSEKMVEVVVADDGEGIAPEVLPRLFDAFFTTKPAGLGTGLGLHVSRTLVRELGGDITIESEMGKGTRVRVVLPVVLV